MWETIKELGPLACLEDEQISLEELKIIENKLEFKLEKGKKIKIPYDLFEKMEEISNNGCINKDPRIRTMVKWCWNCRNK